MADNEEVKNVGEDGKKDENATNNIIEFINTDEVAAEPVQTKEAPVSETTETPGLLQRGREKFIAKIASGAKAMAKDASEAPGVIASARKKVLGKTSNVAKTAGGGLVSGIEGRFEGRNYGYAAEGGLPTGFVTPGAYSDKIKSIENEIAFLEAERDREIGTMKESKSEIIDNIESLKKEKKEEESKLKVLREEIQSSPMGSEEVSKLNIVANQAKWTIERITNEILSEERKLNEKDKTRFKYDDEIKKNREEKFRLEGARKENKIKYQAAISKGKAKSGSGFKKDLIDVLDTVGGKGGSGKFKTSYGINTDRLLKPPSKDIATNLGKTIQSPSGRRMGTGYLNITRNVGVKSGRVPLKSVMVPIHKQRASIFDSQTEDISTRAGKKYKQTISVKDFKLPALKKFGGSEKSGAIYVTPEGQYVQEEKPKIGLENLNIRGVTKNKQKYTLVQPKQDQVNQQFATVNNMQMGQTMPVQNQQYGENQFNPIQGATQFRKNMKMACSKNNRFSSANISKNIKTVNPYTKKRVELKKKKQYSIVKLPKIKI